MDELAKLRRERGGIRRGVTSCLTSIQSLLDNYKSDNSTRLSGLKQLLQNKQQKLEELDSQILC